MADIRTIEFHGVITPGVGRYSDMTIPGRSALDAAPDDWPEELCRGSLNVLVETYPKGFSPPVNRTGGAYQLDDEAFSPAFVIPGELIAENLLKDNDGRPASAQVWRARLKLKQRGDVIECWVLRRFGSNVGKGGPGNVLEIVSDTHLRTAHNLKDGEPVALELIEGL